MVRLSSPIENIKSHYTAVVVGSGYGGGIAACRLARAGQKVCVLERGKEFQPGEYPNTILSALAEMQADLPDKHIGPRTGLYDFHINQDINVFVGCGLGGTSLVNANVALRPEPRVFDDARWPRGLLNDVQGLLQDSYRRAEEMLKPTPYPHDFPTLRKLQALEVSAAQLKAKFYRPPINVNFKDGVNHVGVAQQACKLCGDCVSGCNYGSKNTVLMNYLPDAKNHGAEIYTEVSVRRLEHAHGRWVIHYQPLQSSREGFGAPSMFVTADIVILAAGTLGSTEILLRSRDSGLLLSEKLGHNFTGNGDVLGFGYNNDSVINGIGFGHHSPGRRDPVGPCITGIIDMRDQPELNDGIVIEEGSVPGGLASFIPHFLATASRLVGKDTDRGVLDFWKERLRVWYSLVPGAPHGATRNTQVYLVMGHDDGAGRLYLEDDRLRIDWPGVGTQPMFAVANELLKEATKPLGGTYVKNPAWSKLTSHNLVTVHPLGGCVVAEDAQRGVVNHKGQVFAGSQGTAVYDGLYVCDGSVIPRSLGLNPLLTISALSERTCALLAKDRGWEISYQLPSAGAEQVKSSKVGFQFTETMRGYISTEALDDYRNAAAQGKGDDSKFEFTLTIITDDLDKMLVDAAHQAKMLGRVIAPALSPHPLNVRDGEFNLFVSDPDRVDTRRMRYRMKMISEEGRTYYFEGLKVIHNDPGFDLWSDTTTLYITVYDGEGADSPMLGKGILTIDPKDFLRQMTTMQVNNARNLRQELEATARFGRFFAGTLYEIYGGVFATPKLFNPDAPPRQKRPLRVDAPQVHYFKTSDDVQLRLTRYQGGPKGPVVLSHGLGVSSKIFTIDTIETSLLEYLYAHRYDIWLLDYRASIDLPSSALQFNADDVATRDYPAAVDKVRELTGADSVQMVVHCFGATTFFMAMLAGLKGVRSAVCSQIATHLKVPAVSRIKAGLHLPDLLDALGVETMTAYADTHANWLQRLYNRALSLYPIQPEERCNSATCHRITFMYAPLYEHDQLNETTHNVLHEMFGIANMGAFDHLSIMARKGQLVAADGSDIYLPHLERLAIPITFIHGAENACFLPESTEITYNLLREKNGPALYRRRVIPNYGHIDCIFGKNASKDVYPVMLEHLEGIGA